MQAIGSCNVVITTGGVSMGETDLLKNVLKTKFNSTTHFGRVNMKPGKPTTFVTVAHTANEPLDPAQDPQSNCLVFALPGNPVSASVTFNLFALPALRKMSGMENPFLPELRAKVTFID